MLDPATGAVTKAAEGLKWPYRMLFTPDGRQVIVPDPTLNEVRFIDRAARREIGKLALPGAPQGDRDHAGRAARVPVAERRDARRHHRSNPPRRPGPPAGWRDARRRRLHHARGRAGRAAALKQGGRYSDADLFLPRQWSSRDLAQLGSRPAASLCAARLARAHRHQAGLPARTVRHVHGAAGRRGGAVVRGADEQRGGSRRHDNRGAGHRRRSPIGFRPRSSPSRPRSAAIARAAA